MSDLETVLQGANVRRAVVIDDGYDEVPVAKDLAEDAAEWSQFFEDLIPADENQIRSFFPRYDDLRADELPSEDEFIALLWNHRAELRQEVIGPLFERYTTDKEQDLRYLKTITDCLDSCNLSYKTAGKVFEEKASDADLVIIDLFLDSAQDREAFKMSVEGLKRVIDRRPAAPPLVVLMSRSGRLKDKRKEFRDTVGILESAFRIIRKAELTEEGMLDRLLTRLAKHYADSLRLAAFLDAWKRGLAQACERTAGLIRTLDLADHAQIRQLLLAQEDEPTGSYLVDVFDRVLQHEIEREEAIIDAALELNTLTSDVYPPPYVAGSRDLQSLVFRSLFQNNGRLRLGKPGGSAVAFGDILRRKAPPAEADAPAPEVANESNDDSAGSVKHPGAQASPTFVPLGEIKEDDVLLVVTPACDLQHLLAKRCLLMKGTLVPLKAEGDWSYRDQPIRTVVYEVTPDERYFIKWDLKHVESLSQEELRFQLAAPAGLEVVARLREAHALELQQKLLSSLGRVGLLAPMPATFPVKVEAYLPGLDRKLFKVSIPSLEDNPAVVCAGRKSDMSASSRLVLCEDACEGLCRALQALDLTTVFDGARAIITEVRQNDELLMLERGVDFAEISETRFKEISAVKPGTSVSRTVALMRNAGDWLQEPLNGSFMGKAGIILVLVR